jgi:hypothetical protein
MGIGTLQKLTTKGIRAELNDGFQNVPSIFMNNVTKTDSDVDIEPYGWIGGLPQPAEVVGDRRAEHLTGFSYNVQNKEYELTILVPRNWLEDDRTNQIMDLLNDGAVAWMMYKDLLFANMLVNGATAGNLAYDGNTFFHDTRTEGDSGAIDNKATSAATTGTIPTSAEFLAALNTARGVMLRYKDDRGNPNNWQAMQQLRIIIPPTYDTPAREAMNATLLSSTTNVQVGAAEIDECPFLTADTKMYFSAVGAKRKGIIYQERTPLSIDVFNSPNEIADRRGLQVILRQRYVFAYGDFRRMLEYTYS